MKITYSPLITQAGGKAGPIVAARWKGIPYIRSLVTPANPNTAGEFGQQEHRARMAKLIAWWQAAEAQFVDYVDGLAQGKPMSGFNLFISRNLYLISRGTIDDRKVAEDPDMVPPGSDIVEVDSVAAVAGAGSKEIDLTWVVGDAVATHKIYVLSGPVSGDGVLPSAMSLTEKDTTLVSAAARTVTMDAGAQWYMILLLVEETVASEFSICQVDWSLSNAA